MRYICKTRASAIISKRIFPLRIEDHHSAWLFKLGVSGQLDPATVREGNRSVTMFVSAISKADLLRRVKELEKQLKAYQQQRSTTV